MPQLPIVDHVCSAAEAREQARHVIALRKIARTVADSEASESWKARSPKYIIAMVCEQFGVREADIMSRCQEHSRHLHPRDVAVYLVHKALGYNYRKIGEIFGRVGSTTRKSVIRVTEIMRDNRDHKVCLAVAAIERKLAGEQ